MTDIRILPHLLEDESLPRTTSDNDSERVLLYVGHLCPDKGTPDLLRAFAAIHRDYPDLRLHLVGECLPPFSATDLQTMVTDLGLEEKVVLRGVLSGQEKWAAYAAAHLFVFPSVAPYESFGLVLVEAMMAGLPVVTSRWRGNLDVLGDSFGGVSYEPKPAHPRALESALRQALDERSQWGSWGTANRRRYESHFSLEGLSDEYGKTILGILDRET